MYIMKRVNSIPIIIEKVKNVLINEFLRVNVIFLLKTTLVKRSKAKKTFVFLFLFDKVRGGVSMKKLFVMICLIMISISSLFGGDTARFVNLGFSGDGAYFMFAQHGFISGAGRAYSDLYIVDVQKNVFTSGGVKHGEFETVIEPGQSSDGALFSILEDTVAQRKRYGISYLEKGRPLYIRIAESDKEEDLNSLQFRDFETDTSYIIELRKSVSEGNNIVSSSFSISLNIEYKNGIEKDYIIGHPDFVRTDIIDYTINRILLSPEGDSLIFIISKQDKDLNVRYMIETVRIR